MSRFRVAATCAAGLACALGLLGLAGCPGSATTSLYTPITGFIIDSQQLTAGLGCGTGAGQVYKYAAIVTLPDKTHASGVFDCFTNGQFANLTNDGGTETYPVAIYAYDKAAFPPQLAPCDDLPADAACPGDDPAQVGKYIGQATWTAQCTATQVQGISQVAICPALTPSGDAGVGDAVTGDTGAGDSGPADAASEAHAAQPAIEIDTASFLNADGGTLRCPTDFDSVFATYSGGGQLGDTALVKCPNPIVISPVVAGAQYSISAALVLSGAAFATVSCQAVASTDGGAHVIARCGAASP